MGIPYAFYYYYNKYNCENELMIDVSELLKMNIEHLFFDYNSLIHPCAQQVLSANHEKYTSMFCTELDENNRIEIIENDIIENCLNYTRFLINQTINQTINPKVNKNVYIIIDGVAPRSKMNQQRERRYKSEFFKVNLDSFLWDSNNITPGTNFMNKLSKKLLLFKEILKNELNINCIISDSNEQGEGEHKIMNIISKLNDDNNCDNNNCDNTKICIYGLDADLIMLSLMNINYDKIILIRDNSFNNNLSEDKKIVDYLNINNLYKYICNDILSHIKNMSINIDYKNIIYDYIVLCFLLGNDFLESLPSLSIKKNGIDTLMKAYANSWKGQYLINKDIMNDNQDWSTCINLIYLRDIMYNLKNHEMYFFKNYKTDELAHTERNVLEQLEQKDTIYFYKSDILKYNEDNYKYRYYMYYGIKENQLYDSCLNYIQGLYWIFGYYNNHIHKNWNWYYKYHNTPFSSDLFEFLRTVPCTQIQKYILDSTELKQSNCFTNIQQLYMVLPKKSLYNILSNIDYINKDVLLNMKYTLLNYKKYYPDKLYVDLIHRKYLWQSKIFFENIDELILNLFH